MLSKHFFLIEYKYSDVFDQQYQMEINIRRFTQPCGTPRFFFTGTSLFLWIMKLMTCLQQYF